MYTKIFFKLEQIWKFLSSCQPQGTFPKLSYCSKTLRHEAYQDIAVCFTRKTVYFLPL